MSLVRIRERLFTGLPYDQCAQALRQVLRDTYLQNEYQVDDTDILAKVTKRSVGKLSALSYRGQTMESYQLRGEMICHLDELLENMVDVRHEENRKGDDRRGVKCLIKGEVDVRIGNKFYRPTVVIRQDWQGNTIVYEISNVGGENGRQFKP